MSYGNEGNTTIGPDSCIGAYSCYKATDGESQYLFSLSYAILLSNALGFQILATIGTRSCTGDSIPVEYKGTTYYGFSCAYFKGSFSKTLPGYP